MNKKWKIEEMKDPIPKDKRETFEIQLVGEERKRYLRCRAYRWYFKIRKQLDNLDHWKKFVNYKGK